MVEQLHEMLKTKDRKINLGLLPFRIHIKAIFLRAYPAKTINILAQMYAKSAVIPLFDG